MPTEDQILVPETLLKKRKSQEKAREERSAEVEKKKKVSPTFPVIMISGYGKLWTWTMVMIHTNFATRPTGRCCRFINHLSGLNRSRLLRPNLYSRHASNVLTWYSQANKEKRGVIFKRAESYVKEYRDAEREKIRLHRLSKQEGTFYVEEEAKLVFVVRIKG